MFREVISSIAAFAGWAVAMTAVAVVAHSQTVATPAVPANLVPPTGNIAYIKASAVGTQNYICLPSGASLAWKFQGPQATLYLTLRWINGEIRQQIMTHYLSPNPGEENAPGRATWQSSVDTSAVWAKKIAESSDPAFVTPGAIPWFLLETAGTRNGPMGGAALIPTTFIQRVNTTGGATPTKACTEAGAIEFVPYTADYIFYRAGSN